MHQEKAILLRARWLTGLELAYNAGPVNALVG